MGRASKVLMVLIGVLLLGSVFFVVRNQTLFRERSELAPGERYESFMFEGRERAYLLYVPSSYSAQNRRSLVLVLHGGGGNAMHAPNMTGFSMKADKEGFIVVYPEGTGRLPGRILTWNSGNCCGYALDNNVDDVGFIRTFLDRLLVVLKIDPARIFVTGISNGAMMAYRLGCELSDRIAAIAPVAGALNVEDCNPTEPVSVITFHGTADQHVLYEGGVPNVRLDPHPRIDKSADYSVSFWVKKNKCSPTADRTVKGNVTMDTYSSCMKGTEVRLYTIKGGTHSWPGGKRITSLGDEPTQEISATEIMWQFFAEHPKRTASGDAASSLFALQSTSHPTEYREGESSSRVTQCAGSRTQDLSHLESIGPDSSSPATIIGRDAR